MTRIRRVLKVDTLVQGLVLVSITLLAIISFLTQQGFIVFSLFGLLLLGGWQVLSALVIGFGFGQKNRLQYLAGVFLYLGAVIGLLSLFSYWDVSFLQEITYVTGLLVIPYLISWWYFYQSYTDLSQRFKIPRSFWDI